LFIVNQAPIALFVYKRPQHTRRAIGALLRNPEAKDSDLYVFSDGPRTEKDIPTIQSIRRELRDIKGFRSVEIVEREKNLGLHSSLTDGISRLTDARGRAIVVEDDLVVAPGFLRFMAQGLDRYADDQRVFSVSGYMYPIEGDGLGETLFLPMTSCWGWATWKRAWVQLDRSLSGLDAVERDAALARRLNLDGAYNYLAMARRQKRGEIDSWGICWHLSAFLKDGLTLYPRESLVENAGVDGSGTHYTAAHKGAHTLLHPPVDTSGPAKASWAFQGRVVTDEIAYARVQHLLRRSRPPIVRRILNWIQA